MTRALLAVAVASLLSGCGSTAADRDARPAQAPRSVATGLQVPWGIAFLPGGDALVAERPTGRVFRVRRGGSRRFVRRIPGVADFGEGGLLGLAVSPTYRRDRWVYAYFTSGSDNRIVRFRLGGPIRSVLTGLQRGTNHDGGRIAFGPDGKLYAGVGDAGDAALSQDRGSQNGKILRMNPNGSVPRDNPFRGSRVWSLGHRNVQGLAWDRAGRLWATEFGQNSFDELNLIRPGRNYGWPVVEGRGDTRGGRFVNPKVTWRTSEASPSGVAIARGTAFIGALGGQRLLRVRLRGTSAAKRTSRLLGRYGRLRTVVNVPGGGLWVTTSNRDGRGSPRPGDDRILRISP